METFQGRQFRNTAKAKDKSVHHSEEPTWMNLEDLMTKEISHQKKKDKYVAWVHLYRFSRVASLLETEGRMVASRGWLVWKMGIVQWV